MNVLKYGQLDLPRRGQVQEHAVDPAVNAWEAQLAHVAVSNRHEVAESVRSEILPSFDNTVFVKLERKQMPQRRHRLREAVRETSAARSRLDYDGSGLHV